MKKKVLGFFLLITITAYSQENQLQVLCNEKVLGINLIDSSAINGLEYVFCERIHETFLDTTTGFLTAQLRGVSKKKKRLDNIGLIVQYDIKNQKVLWSEEIDYQINHLQQFSKTMIYTVRNKSYCLDINTGNELWRVKNNISIVIPFNNIGIGYKSTGLSDRLEGINLENGNILWSRDLSRGHGWDNVFYINDSTIIVVAAGLHAININTGKGWDYNTITSEKDYTGIGAANAVGFVAGLLTGTVIIPTGYNLIQGLVSNTIVDSSSIYFASKEQLAKINKQSGEVIWTFPFSEDLVSKSSIFMNDSLIFMINKGMAFMGERQLDFGKPFFAAFDKQTGRQVFISLINVKDDPILGFNICNGKIFLALKNKIVGYSMDTGVQIIEKEFPKDNFGELEYFVGSQVFITNANGDFINLLQSDSAKVYVFTNQRKILSLDEDMNITKTIDSEELSVYYQRTMDFKFIAKDKNTLILNNEGEKIAEVGVSANSFVIDNTLYDIQENKLITIDLAKIVNKITSLQQETSRHPSPNNY